MYVVSIVWAMGIIKNLEKVGNFHQTQPKASRSNFVLEGRGAKSLRRCSEKISCPSCTTALRHLNEDSFNVDFRVAWLIADETRAED